MADAVFVGGAPAVKQITTLTVAGTPGASETLTVTANSKSMVVTIPTGQTTSQVAAEIAASLMANDQTDPAPPTGYSRSCGGREIPEFLDFIAEASGSTIILTSTVSGTPFTVTLAESMAFGTFTQAATQAATGPEHADNAANYRSGSLPANNDTFKAEGSANILHGLTYFLTNTIALHVEIDLGVFSGQIGLASTNPGGYDEYRQRHLQLYSVAANEKKIVLWSSTGQSLGTLPIYLEGDADHTSIVITAGRGTPTTPNIELINFTQTMGTLVVSRGSVKLIGTPYTELLIGSDSGNSSDCLVVLANGCDLQVVEQFVAYSGTLRTECDTAFNGLDAWPLVIHNATVIGTKLSATPDVRSVRVHQGGTYKPHYSEHVTDGAIIEVLPGGTLDMRGASAFQDWLVKLYAQAILYDPQALAGPGPGAIYHLLGCSPSQLAVFDVAANLVYTSSALP